MPLVRPALGGAVPIHFKRTDLPEGRVRRAAKMTAKKAKAAKAANFFMTTPPATWEGWEGNGEV